MSDSFSNDTAMPSIEKSNNVTGNNTAGNNMSNFVETAKSSKSTHSSDSPLRVTDNCS
ncbi:hypothetical protein M7I_0889 [Glarea lozoyensis 74030]|uniref:Uncharacterized protein n=1 Tax=Glarea lozoyensis (strain ATCC 74030 / MF5533) TaxID=1104152 RepID=H0EEK9_GLAL7|nr:hypothetical protein M7I_0889 [Glarea lozoyensis 74030]